MTTSNGLSAAVAATLSGERVASRLTLDDLSDRSGIPTRTLKRYLSGDRDMKLDVVEALASALGLTLGEVFTAAEKRRDRMARSDTPNAQDAAS